MRPMQIAVMLAGLTDVSCLTRQCSPTGIRFRQDRWYLEIWVCGQQLATNIVGQHLCPEKGHYFEFYDPADLPALRAAVGESNIAALEAIAKQVWGDAVT